MSTDAVVIWGEVLWDRFLERSSTSGGDQLGGAPANLAWHLGQAGGWAQLVTRVGDDEDGRRAIARLAEVIDTSLVQVDPTRATGEVTVHLENGEPRYRLHPGRAWEHIACTPEVTAAIGEAGVFVFGTLAQRRPEGLAAWRTAVTAAAHCLKVCDLNLRPTDQDAPAIREALDAADVIKLNDRELATLRDWFGWRDPIAELRTRPRTIAVTHGAAGSTLHGDAGQTSGRSIEIAPTPAPPGGDNVGCGDAYLAILVHGMTLGWDLEASARAASRWAAAVAGHRGATPLFDDDQIAQLLDPAA